MNSTTLGYQGDVKVTLTINNKKIELYSHNAGEDALKKSLCNFLVGNPTESIPQNLDLRYYNEETNKYDSMLNILPSLSGKTVKYDSTLHNWVASFTSSINYTMINEPTVSASDSRKFKLFLCNMSGGDVEDLASLPISAETLSKILPGVQISVEWVMQIINVAVNAD